MILSDFDLRSEVQAKRIIIDPFYGTSLTSNGYDLSVGEIVIERADSNGIFIPHKYVGKKLKYMTGKDFIDVVVKGKEPIEIPPMTAFLVSTVEQIVLQANTGASLYLKSKWARKNVMATFGFVDAGFNGTLTLSLFNASRNPLYIALGDRIVQICFHRLSSRAELDYAKRSGHFQNESGVTVEPKKD